ncbi:MAG: protein O-mannosyl-transferase family [Candidatus Promineifilaceae bacterium]
MLTLPRGLSWDLGGVDGGELAAAVYTQGLVHSPGYPTYLLLAQIVHFLPIFPFAIRLNIFSAACAIVAAYFIGKVSQQQQGRQGQSAPIAISILFWGLHELVWSQAIIAEVYALASIFCILLLYITPQTENEATRNRWLLYGLIAGIGIGSHYLIVFIVMWSILFVWQKGFMANGQWAIIGVILGLLVFAWLPIRAGANLHNNWGNPNSLANFWWVVSGAAYAGRLNLLVSPGRIFSLIALIFNQATIIGVILIVFGFVNWWEDKREWVIASLIMSALNIWVVAAYDSADILSYLYPSLLLYAIAAGSGLQHIVQQLPAPLSKRAALTSTFITLLLASSLIYRVWPLVSQTTLEAETFGTTVIEATSPNSMLITSGEEHTFSVRYAAAVNNRDDLILIDINLLNFTWYQEDILRQLGMPIASLGELPLLVLVEIVPKDMPIYTTVPERLSGEWKSAENGLIHQFQR